MGTIDATLPDATTLVQTGASVQSGIGSLTALLQALRGGEVNAPGSPLAALGTALGGLGTRTQVDTSALSSALPARLSTMGAALAPSGLDFARSLEQDFASARDLIADNPVVQAVGSGQSLQQVALAAVQQALDAFDQQRAQLVGRLLPSGDLQQLVELLDTLARLGSDYAAHRDELLPLLSRYLVGRQPDLLAPLVGHVQQVLALADAWSAAPRAGAEQAAATLQRTLHDLLLQVDAFDPQSAAAYDALDALLDAIAAELPPLVQALGVLQDGTRAALDSDLWDRAFATYTQLLDAIPFEAVPVPADAVGALASVFESLLTRLEAQFTPEDIAAKVRALSAALHEVFDTSPLGQVRQVIRDFLQRIVQAIGAIPTEKIEQTLQSAIGTVGEQLQALGLDQVAEQIESGFVAVETFVRDTLNEALGQQVAQALAQLLSALDGLPVDTLVDQVAALLAQLQQALQQVQQALEGAAAQLTALLEQLDGLSFKPVGDAVVAEIEALRQKVASLNPNAMSDIEKGALQAALAVVRAVDLEGIVQREVKSGFASARDAALDALQRVTGVLDGVRERVRLYSPEALVQQLSGLLLQGQRAVQGLDAQSLIRPLYAEVERLGSEMARMRPGALLQPLAAPYSAVRDGVAQLDPTRLVQPLESLYAGIDEVIDKVDVVPVLEELDRRQRALLGDLRNAIVAALDALQLPPPLDGLYAQVKPVLQQLTSALLAEPGADLKTLGLSLATQLKPSDLFKPLDDAWGRLVDLLGSVPAADLEAAFETLRLGLAVALVQIDPARVVQTLRQARGTLADLSPRVLASGALQLPSLQPRFELRAAGASASVQAKVQATRLKFGSLLALVDGNGSAFAAATTRHDQLEAALKQRIAALDASGAQAAHARADTQLRRLLPEFLFASAALTRADIVL
ncbi:MAG TPA: hypothetical protein PLW24_19395, partial [Burkholderiaceae bacterium]|nr:hypothetical protein [Burkholderiaceae bacterium]